MNSARVRDMLQRVVKKIGLKIRLTTHGARKGSAVESVMAGAPLPLLQAWGGWCSIDSLQHYIGSAIRMRISPLEWLENKSLGGPNMIREGREQWCYDG